MLNITLGFWQQRMWGCTGLCKAREWYLKAAEQGHASAQYNLGFMYNNGEGAQDYAKGEKLVSKSC